MGLHLNREDLKGIAYIRILEFAANQAVGYKLCDTQGNNAGFTYAELCGDEKIKAIKDKDWLKETVLTICNIYNKNDVEIKNANVDNITDEAKLVIKAGEFMKFISLIEHEKSESNIVLAKKHLMQR